MRIGIVAVGRMKSGPERGLADRYLERFAKSGPAIGLEFSGVDELPESRAASSDARKKDESLRILERIAPGSILILLDERGKNIPSQDLAHRIAAWRDAAAKSLALSIGGADGHDAGLRQRADLVLSFGAQTWPHQMVRIMAAEQLYRAVTILSGHPYHRA